MKNKMIKRVKELGANALIASSDFRDFVEKFESEINRGISTLAILRIIDESKNGIHGYGLLKVLEEKTNSMLIIEEGTLYPILRKLEKKQGLIESTKRTVEGRKRKVYTMTPEGKKIFNHMIGYYTKLTEAIAPL